MLSKTGWDSKMKMCQIANQTRRDKLILTTGWWMICQLKARAASHKGSKSEQCIFICKSLLDSQWWSQLVGLHCPCTPCLHPCFLHQINCNSGNLEKAFAMQCSEIDQCLLFLKLTPHPAHYRHLQAFPTSSWCSSSSPFYCLPGKDCKLHSTKSCLWRNSKEKNRQI